MASARTSAALEIRRLRKKLRQIENLECLDRELSDQEMIKIEKKYKLRSELLGLLATNNTEESEESTEVSTRSDISTSQGGDVSLGTDDLSVSDSFSELSNVEVTIIAGEDKDNNEPIDVETVDGEGDGEGDFIQVKCSNKNKREEQTERRKDFHPTDRDYELVVSKSPTKKRKVDKSPNKESPELRAAVHQWRSCSYDVIELKSHSDLITDVSADENLFASASRDTTVKLWDLYSMAEIRSYGGHTSTVTSVCLLNIQDSSKVCKFLDIEDDCSIIISGSLDCTFKIWSSEDGQVLQSTYTYNPINKVVYHSVAGVVITGSDGGKLELWDIKSKQNLQSISCFDSAFTGLQVNENMVYCSSCDGLIKVFDMREKVLACMFVSENVHPANGRKVTVRHVRGLTAMKGTVFFGDDGSNIKVLNWRKGMVDKFMNHVEEFGITDSLYCHNGVLLSSAYDIDTGNGYLNVRYLPDGNYLSTFDDEDTDRIIAISATTMSDGKTVIITAGPQLKVWITTENDRDGNTLQTKFFTKLAGQAVDSDMESDTDLSESGEDDGRAPSNRSQRRSSSESKSSVSKGWFSWCSVL